VRRAILCLTLTACGLPEEQHAEALATASCKLQRRCDRGAFDSTYDNLSECEDAIIGLFDDLAALNELLGCEYDPDGGRELLHDIRSSSCEEYDEGDGVDDANLYDCGG
jgi:hypothetical protein